jgi:hypothetical protein
MTAGSPNLIVTNGTFTAGDVGKLILVEHAGPGGKTNDLLAAIQSVTNPSNVVLSVNASRTATDANVVYGTDDATAIQSGLNYAVSNKLTLYFPLGIYVVNGTFQHPTNKNSIFTIPNFSEPMGGGYTTAYDVAHPVKIEGETLGTTGGGVKWFGWDGSWVAVVNCTNAAGGNVFQFGDNTVGTWSNDGDAGTAGYNNVVVRMKGMGIRLPNNTTLNAVDAMHTSGASFEDVNVFAGHNSYSSVIYPTTDTFGIRMPDNGLNGNGLSTMDRVQIAGFYKGIYAAEHTDLRSVTIYSSVIGVYFRNGAYHLASGSRLGLQSCVYGIQFSGDPAYVNFNLEIEHGTGSFETIYDIQDAGNLGTGFIFAHVYNSRLKVNGGANLKIIQSYGDTTGNFLAPTAGASTGYLLSLDNGTNKWISAPAGSQTPWTSDINAAGKSLTNANQITATNGIFITGTMYPPASMANGAVQLWNSNGILYSINKSTGGTVTTNKLAP